MVKRADSAPERGQMTTVYLIRHAENDHVATGKLAGWLPDVHLNARGQVQAAALPGLFSSIRLKAIYSSPLERAVETAQPLARSQKLSLETRAGIGEIQYGSWQGRSLKALRKRKLWPVVQFSPSLARFPGGESFTEAQARIVNEIETLRTKHSGEKTSIACVSHADAIKLAIAHYLGLPLDLFQRLTIEPASVSILRINHGARLIRMNDNRATRTASEG
jgi:probable phosphomutase (TIGR03848 family)